MRSKFVGLGAVRGVLYDLGELPGAAPSEKSTAQVHGEVYRLPDPLRALKVLDEVEGIAPGSPEHNLYRRALASIKLENGTKVEAWIYWLRRMHEPKRRIFSGDYAKIVNCEL